MANRCGWDSRWPFTGCDPIERAQLAGRAIAAGLRVTGTVTTKTAALVTDGVNPNTVKARRARDLGTRIVSPDMFAYLLTHIQPALTATSGPTPQQARISEAATATADQTAEDPATIRAWARANGHRSV